MKSEIIQLEQRLMKAMLDSNVRVLDELISDHLIFTDHSGRILSKQSDLEAHRSGTVSIDLLEPKEQIIRVYGQTAIVSLLLTIKGQYMNEAFEGTNRYTRVWQKEGDSWRIIAGHSSTVEHK